MVKKAPRRTAQRILETALDLFNQHGEPNVSTALIAEQMGISPGNLHYHYPSKVTLIDRLYADYVAQMAELLPASASVRDVEDAWFFLHSLFELTWRYRFFFRDLNDLLSRSRHLETQIQQSLAAKVQAIHTLIGRLRDNGHLTIEARELDALAHNALVLLNYWLNYEYTLNPRHALEPEQAQHALLRGARHTLQLIAPYLAQAQREHLLALSQAYAETEPGEPASLQA
ncbi:MAG: TetR/AcrR family transcriptional regulator [Burkholderiaceae bacterium]|jgi:AcrR family transcriptional regulator|nr:TetR/AcrR family transcriptional regulator [Burkholderiaceae bacterium]